MSARPHRPSRWTTAATTAVCAAALAAHVVTGSALGALQARIDNSANTAAAGTLLYTHSYGSNTCTSIPTGDVTDAIRNVACTKSVYPARVPASGTAAQTDAITATGNLPSVRVTQQAKVSSCGAVALANDKNSPNPMVARNGTNFGVAGPFTGATAISLDGANPGGYETSVVAQSQPTGPAIIGSARYGMGIWFNATSGTAGPLFGFAASSGNAAGSTDHILYLNSSGQIGFLAAKSGTPLVSSTGGFNDGQWHFAYVRIDTTRVVLGLGYTVTIYLDGRNVASASSDLLGALSSFSGYWHLGWSTVSGTPSYFNGSLADFVVLNNGSAPSVLSGSTSSTAFDTATAAATERWHLDDDGKTVASAYTSALPVPNAPCSYVDIEWGFTNPTSCAVTPHSTTAACTGATKLTGFVASGAQTVASAVPSTVPLVAQVSTITLSRDTTYAGAPVIEFLGGLMIYAPVTLTMSVGTTQWTTAFSWADSAGSTFLL